MSTSVMNVDGKQVAEVNFQPTQINIHIHQESSLAKLLQSGHTFLQSKFYSQDTLKQSKRVLQAQIALGVSLILLGVLSCSFGIFLYFGPWIPLQATGCAFWAGAVAVTAGVGAIIYENCQRSCWGRLAALLTLISISTALAALILCSFSLENFVNRFSNLGEICEQKNSTMSYHRRYGYRGWMTEECKSNMDMLLFLFQGVQVMLLVICVLILLVSLASLGVGLHNLCCQNSQFQVEEGTERKLLGKESLPHSPCREKSTGVISL